MKTKIAQAATFAFSAMGALAILVGVAFLLVEAVRPEGVAAEFRTTPNPAQADGVFRSQGQWVVRAGVPGLQKA